MKNTNRTQSLISTLTAELAEWEDVPPTAWELLERVDYVERATLAMLPRKDWGLWERVADLVIREWALEVWIREDEAVIEANRIIEVWLFGEEVTPSDYQGPWQDAQDKVKEERDVLEEVIQKRLE